MSNQQKSKIVDSAQPSGGIDATKSNVKLVYSCNRISFEKRYRVGQARFNDDGTIHIQLECFPESGRLFIEK